MDSLYIQNYDKVIAKVITLDIEGNTALCLALMDGCDIEAIRRLLEDGADVNKTNSAGQSPLCIALQNPDCNLDHVDLILKAGAAVNACCLHESFLHCYSANAKQIIPDILKLLLVKQIGEQRFYRESLCLALGMETCRVEVVKALLEMGCHVHSCLLHDSSFSCYFGDWTSLANECRDLDEEVIKLLLGRVTKFKRVYGCLRSPLCLYLLRSKCKLAIVKLFLEANTYIRCHQHESDFQCLIEKPSSVFRRNPTLSVDILKLFLSRGSDIHQLNSIGNSAFYTILHNFTCNVDVLQVLLDAGARMNECSLHGSTLMCYAITNEVKADVIKLFLDRGCDAHEVSYTGTTTLDTPLHSILRFSKYEVAAITVLMDHPGFDVNKTGKNGASYLHCALLNSYYKRSVTKLLLNRGARADAVDSRGNTPLNIAVQNPYCDTDIMKMLLDKGCPVFTITQQVSPLENVLWRCRRIDVLRLLLIAGVPININCSCDSRILMGKVLILYDIVKNQDCLNCLELFVKYALLLTPHSDIVQLAKQRIRSHFRLSALVDFVYRCVNEVKDINMLYVAPGLSLRQLAAGLKKEVTYDFNVLLKILASNKLPFYFDIISARVERILIEDKLHELNANLRSDLPCKGKIVLDCHSTFHVGRFLSDKDLLSYLVALLQESNKF